MYTSKLAALLGLALQLASTIASPIPSSPATALAAPQVFESEADSDERRPPMPIIHFTLDASNTTAYSSEIFFGPLKAGKEIMVTYDPIRAKCRGSDPWSVSLSYKSTTSEIHTQFAQVAYVESWSHETVSRPAIIPPMPAGQFEVWFRCANAIPSDSDAREAEEVTQDFGVFMIEP
ncbi:hypothetical protein HK102_009918 [Quaeritorhiza haematococci]|nr:hypothetical protein HK102_009918 [Quaeritorhiza haematococci]